MAIAPARKPFLSGLTAALIAGFGAVALAFPQSAPAAPGDPTTDMPSLVEDFHHPGAARAQQERGVTLKRGDGHIWLTDVTDLSQCGDASNIAIESRKGIFCFKTNSKSGHLILELPDTFSIWTQAHPVKATLTADGKDTVVNAPANELTPVGESGDSGQRSVLVEIRVTG
ncbi:hypothetical protein ACFV28_10775 [Streptomyces sp. NPDC059720]|uniref:hypothetical protein n=1 Tax=Streptomyces sp. NPDC059720 TaxID=3346924 RepID=UPI0036B248BB